MKDTKFSRLLDRLVVVLVIFQLFLIGAMTVSVISITRDTRKALQGTENTTVQTEPTMVADSLQVAAPIVKEKVVHQDAIADNSPTIISIILTLITLCVTLSIVIPYVQGKTMTEGKIREVASEYYRDAFAAIERNHQAVMEDSIWEDAHHARMIAYLLLKSNDVNDKVWSIGWASKSLLRYLKLTRKFPDRYGDNNYHVNDFIKKSIDYLKEADQVLSTTEIKNRKKEVLRAFSDLSLATFLAQENDCFPDLDSLLKNVYDQLVALSISPSEIGASLYKHKRQKDGEDLTQFWRWSEKWLKNHNCEISLG